MDEKCIALIAMVISICAAFVSIWQAIIAKKALNITEEQNKLLASRGELCLINSSKIKTLNSVFVLVDCTIINQSRTEDTIIKSCLIVEYKNESGIIVKLILDHNPLLTDSLKIELNDLSKLPIGITANGACKCTFIYELNNEIFNNCIVRDYLIEVDTAAGLKISKGIAIIPFMES